jgi:mutator protein MutT
MGLETHPGNVIKFCPRCGSNQFVTNDKGRSFKCEGCHFHFYVNSSAAVACLIFNQEGKLLLTRRAIEPGFGMLDLPGGFIEPMEAAEAAVKREIEEELGVKVTKVQYMTSFPNEYVFSGYSVFTMDMAFICEVANHSTIIPADDVSAVEFIFAKELKLEELFSDSMRNIVSYYITKYL